MRMTKHQTNKEDKGIQSRLLQNQQIPYYKQFVLLRFTSHNKLNRQSRPDLKILNVKMFGTTGFFGHKGRIDRFLVSNYRIVCPFLRRA